MGFGRKKERGEIPHRSSPSTATPPSLSTTFIPDRILPKMLRTAWESVNLPASNGASSARRVRVSLVEVGRGTQSDEKPEGRQCKPEKLGVGSGRGLAGCRSYSGRCSPSDGGEEGRTAPTISIQQLQGLFCTVARLTARIPAPVKRSSGCCTPRRQLGSSTLPRLVQPSQSRPQTGHHRWTFLLAQSLSGLRLTHGHHDQPPNDPRSVAQQDPPWIMKSLMIRWKTVPAKAKYRG